MLLYAMITALAVSLVVSRLALPKAISLAQQHSLLDIPGRHKRHKRPIPILGGAVLMISFWAGIGCVALIFPGELNLPLGSLGYILAAALMISMVGFSDDLRPLSASVKLTAQVGAALVLYLGGLQIDPVTIPFLGSYETGSLSILTTVLWVVGLTNAINLIDGLDGLAAGVSLIAAITLGLLGLLYNIGAVVVLAAAMVGFLIVFLFYNRYPARIFLGDSGSLQIGFYFAVVSLLVPFRSYTAAALYLPLLALGVPLLEAAISITRRLVAGRNVFKADRRHLFHYLALAGLAPNQIVLIFYLLSAVFGGFALAMHFWNRLVVFGLLALFMVVIFAGFFIFMANFAASGKGRSPNEKE